MNEDYFMKWLLDEIEWFHFQEILEHTDFYAKVEKILLHSLLKMFHMFYIRLWSNKHFHADVIGIK